MRLYATETQTEWELKQQQRGGGNMENVLLATGFVQRLSHMIHERIVDPSGTQLQVCTCVYVCVCVYMCLCTHQCLFCLRAGDKSAKCENAVAFLRFYLTPPSHTSHLQ